MKSIYKTILSKFITASLIPVLFIELSLVIALFWMNEQQSQVTKATLSTISSNAFSEIAELTGTQIQQQFVQVKHEISQLSYLVSLLFSHPARYQHKQAEFYFDRGFFRDGVRGELSSVYTTNLQKLSKQDTKNLQLLSLLLPHVKHLVDANKELLQGAWINISKYYSLFYPKLDVPNELSSDLDVTKQAFYYKADSVHNPKKEIVFISLYTEEWATQFGQMGAYLSPIYVKDKFRGTIGVNVTVKKIAQTFANLQLPFNAYAMLVDKKRRLLISSDENRSFHDTVVHSYYNNYMRSISNKKLLELKPMQMNSLSKSEKIIFSQEIKDTDFTIMFCADNEDIYGPVQARYEETKTIGYYIVIAIALFYVVYALLMLKGIRQLAFKIYKPLHRMVDFSSKLGSSEMVDLPHTNISELEALNKNFMQTHQRLINLINFDQTTALYNHQKLRNDVKLKKNVRLIFFKLKNFDQYNNLFGPSVGKFALKEMVKQIQVCANDTGELYRENQDTIAMLIEDSNTEHIKKHVIEMIETLERATLLFEGVDISLSVKAGMTLGERDDGIDLFAQTHIALAEAVARDIDRYVAYEDIHMVTRQYQENLLWSKHVKDALLDKRLVAFFQPIYSYKSGKIEKFESLVRMELNGEIISPFRFLDAARSSGKLHEITLVMVDQVFAMAKLYPEIEFSVNTSFVDFEEGKLLDFVKQKLKDTDIDSSKIIFELLETQTFANESIAAGMIAELKSLGFKIAIDDFGTGHSNFAHVAAIEVDYIKIDGMFVKSLETDKMSEQMVKTIVSFAQGINALTIAEFVHNEAVFNHAKALGVDYAQGYYKSPPISKEDVGEMLVENKN